MSHYIGETAAAVVSTEPVGCFAPLSLRSTSLLRGVRTTYPNRTLTEPRNLGASIDALLLARDFMGRRTAGPEPTLLWETIT